MPPDDLSGGTPRNNDQYASPVPAAIRRQALAAEAVAREAGIANVPDAPKTETVEPPLVSVSDAPAPTTVEGEAAAPQAAPEAGTSAPPTQPTQPTQPSIDWQQRYNTLRGKYDAEIPDLQTQLRGLHQAMAAMQSAPREAPREVHRETPRAPTPPADEIPAEDREAYGEELIHKTQGWAEMRLSPRLSQLERRLIEIEGRSNQVSQDSAKAQVEQQLDRAIPSWNNINQDPEFWSWLNQPDPFSGTLRRALLTDAHTRGDAARAIAFFQAFQREHTVVDPGPGTQPTHTTRPDAGAVAERLPLETLAAPGRGTTSLAAPGAPERRTWNPAQVSALYREKTEGRWDGREDDFRRLEQDMIASTREGRFRN